MKIPKPKKIVLNQKLPERLVLAKPMPKQLYEQLGYGGVLLDLDCIEWIEVMTNRALVHMKSSRAIEVSSAKDGNAIRAAWIEWHHYRQ